MARSGPLCAPHGPSAHTEKRNAETGGFPGTRQGDPAVPAYRNGGLFPVPGLHAKLCRCRVDHRFDLGLCSRAPLWPRHTGAGAEGMLDRVGPRRLRGDGRGRSRAGDDCRVAGLCRDRRQGSDSDGRGGQNLEPAVFSVRSGPDRRPAAGGCAVDRAGNGCADHGLLCSGGGGCSTQPCAAWPAGTDGASVRLLLRDSVSHHAAGLRQRLCRRRAGRGQFLESCRSCTGACRGGLCGALPVCVQTGHSGAGRDRSDRSGSGRGKRRRLCGQRRVERLLSGNAVHTWAGGVSGVGCLAVLCRADGRYYRWAGIDRSDRLAVYARQTLSTG